MRAFFFGEENMPSIKESILARAAIGDHSLVMQLDIGDAGFRIDRIAVDMGGAKIFLKNGSIFTARCAEVLGATVHICEKVGVCMKFKFVGGDLTEVS